MEAAVVDPRRDSQVYIDIAAKYGMRISRILRHTAMKILWSDHKALPKKQERQFTMAADWIFPMERVWWRGILLSWGICAWQSSKPRVIPMNRFSIIIRDSNFGNDPIAVFTGDTLFVGDVGRTDFFPDRAEEVAGLIYDSIFNKLLPLGDQTIIYPAHGAGSVCGGKLASREFSTMGYERRNNPMLQFLNRRSFIDHKVCEHHYKPAYFKKMEKYNQQGQPLF